MKKILKYLLYYIVVIGLALCLGFIGWFFLYIVNVILHFLWIGPEVEGTVLNGVMYRHNILIFPFIMLGCLLLGFIFNRIGVYPKPGIYYAKQIKEGTKIVYEDIVKIFFLAMCPLFLGTAAGPEAAVIGIFFICSSLVSDVLLYTQNKLDIDIVQNVEDTMKNKIFKNKFYLIQMLLIYTIVAYVLVHLSALDRFPSFYVKISSPSIGIREILFTIPIGLLALILALFYEKSEHILEKSLSKLGNYQRILLTGAILSIVALTLPVLILSGEATLHILVNQPLMYSGVILLLLAFLKLLLTNLCINGNLRGGHIFPIIFASFLMGSGLGILFDVDLVFTITIVTSTTCLKIFSNIFAVFLLLALFFPMKLLVVVLVILLIIREKVSAENNATEL